MKNSPIHPQVITTPPRSLSPSPSRSVERENVRLSSKKKLSRTVSAGGSFVGKVRKEREEKGRSRSPRREREDKGRSRSPRKERSKSPRREREEKGRSKSPRKEREDKGRSRSPRKVFRSPRSPRSGPKEEKEEKKKKEGGKL